MSTGSSAAQLSHPKYRRDIDGLRAVAVLAVVLFHAFPGWLPGGFIGVDIFFVISGYLISSIIFENLKQDRFSIIEFYQRRIRRIFPALTLVLLTTLALGYLLLFAAEFAQLGRHAVGSAEFIENFVLLNERGYFDNASDTKPLLHLWSLAVEEQFYIIWPLLLALLWRLRLSFLLITASAGLLSFATSIYLLDTNPVADFYSPASRFWELMAGGGLAYAQLRNALSLGRYQAAASAVGFGLLAAGLVLINRDSAFPGWWAMFPVSGATLLIAAGEQAPLNATLLSNRPMASIGLISYPLYLWHWPLLSLLRIVQSGAASDGMRAATVALSILLAWLTYTLVEKPFRYGRFASAKVGALAFLMVLIGFAGNTVASLRGLIDRPVVQNSISHDLRLNTLSTRRCDKTPDQAAHLVYCMENTGQPPRFALLGDSKAGALTMGLLGTAHDDGRWIAFSSGPDSPLVPVLSDDPIYRRYSRPALERTLQQLDSDPHISLVLIDTSTRALFQLRGDDSLDELAASRNYAPALAGLSRTVATLVAAHKRVILLVDNPTLPHPEDCTLRRTPVEFINGYVSKINPDCNFSLDRYLRQRQNYLNLLNAVHQQFPDRVILLDTTDILCDEKTRICPHFRDGHAMYWITDHISNYASVLIGQRINDYVAAHSY